jgi:MFS family permease
LKAITRTVWLLAFISLLTDAASEMLYPVLPLYLQSIGFSVFIIGILEGVAEAVSGLSKGYFGKESDRLGKRVPFVQAGYLLSALSKPMIAIFTNVVWVFFSRTLDRLGKGIRTGARDALLSEEASHQYKGTVFGFHRAFDTAGAVIGPMAALIYLYFFPEDYRTLFFLAFIPGALAVITSLFLKEKKKTRLSEHKAHSFLSFLKYWKQSPARYRRLVAGLLVFSLVNSSDVFLLLKVKEAGMTDSVIIGLYVFYNLIYALFAFPAGMLADRLGLKKIFIIGLVLFSLVYAGMAFSSQLILFVLLFFIYGLYASATEGIARAWICTVIGEKETATAIGTFTALQSIALLLASSFTGIIWSVASATIALMISASVSFLLVFYFFSLNDSR